MSSTAAVAESFGSTIFSSFFQEHSFKGKLTFDDGSSVIHRRVDIYAKYWFISFKVGEMVSDENGQFKSKVFSFKTPFTKEQEFVFKVYNKALPWYGNPAKDRLVDEISFKKPHTSASFNPQLRPSELLAYQTRMPLLRQPKDSKWQPQQWPLYDQWIFIKGVLKSFIQAFRFSGDEKATIKDYDLHFEKSNVQLGEKHTLEMITRGIYMPVWMKTERENELQTEIIWDKYSQDKESPKLPNAGIRIKIENGKPSIVSVWKHYQGFEKVEAKRGDKNFLNVLYSFNSAALVRGQVNTHLQLHTEMEQVSIPADRYLMKNPIGGLLKPHLRETQVINHMGSSDIFGEEGILNVSALTKESILDVMEDYLGGRDFLDFKPRKTMFDDDRFALAQQDWWERFGKVVDQFYQKNEKEILKHWKELYLFSKAYHSHSVPYRPWDGNSDPSKWWDSSEVFQAGAPARVEGADGVIRSVREITTVEKNPSEAEIENLKQFLRYVLTVSMFRHSVVHASQKEFGAIRYATLAPEGNGEGRYAETKKKNAFRQSRIGKAIVGIDPDNEQAAIKNAHKEIHPLVMKALHDLKPKLKSYGIDIDLIRHSVDL